MSVDNPRRSDRADSRALSVVAEPPGGGGGIEPPPDDGGGDDGGGDGSGGGSGGGGGGGGGEPQFTVQNITVSPNNPEVGTDAQVQVTIENVGTAEGNASIPVQVNNDAVGSAVATSLSPGESNTVSTDFTVPDDQRLDVRADNLVVGIDTSSPSDGGGSGDSNIRITTMSILGGGSFEPGSTATVTAIWLNDGDSSGEASFPLSINGNTERDISVSLGPGESTQKEIDISVPSNSGQLNVGIGNTSDTAQIGGSGSLSVTGVDIPGDGTVEQGSTVGVTFTFENTNSVIEQETYPLEVNGETAKQMDISVLAGEESSLTVDVTVPNSDIFTVSADGVSDSANAVSQGAGIDPIGGGSGDGNILTNPATIIGGAALIGGGYYVLSQNNAL